MTIGSFVCTACSGQLRGLNPPHRVKSISMASFTQEEVEFVRSRGNDFCRKVWLGLYNSSQHKFDTDIKDDNKIRDFMAIKYEKKRFYIAPTEDMLEEARRMNEPPKAEPVTKPLRSLGNIPNLQVQQQSMQNKAGPPAQPGTIPAHSASHPFSPNPAVPAQEPKAANSSGLDLLGEIGGDPFTAAPRPAQHTGIAVAPGGFADFSAFGGPTQTTGQAHTQQAQGQQIQSAGSLTTTNVGATSSAADRYSALAELDSVFGGPVGAGSNSVTWENVGWTNSTTPSTHTTPASSFNTGGSATVNPFNSTGGSFGGLTNGAVSSAPVGGWALPGMTNTPAKPAQPAHPSFFQQQPPPQQHQQAFPTTSQGFPPPQGFPPQPGFPPQQGFPQSNSQKFPHSTSQGFPASSQGGFGSFSQGFNTQSSSQSFATSNAPFPSSQQSFGAPQQTFSGQQTAAGFGQPPAFSAQQSNPNFSGAGFPPQQTFGGQSSNPGFSSSQTYASQGGFGAPPPNQAFAGSQQQFAPSAGFPAAQSGFSGFPAQQGYNPALGSSPGQHISGQFMSQWGQPAANPFLNVTNQSAPQKPLNSTNPFL